MAARLRNLLYMFTQEKLLKLMTIHLSMIDHQQQLVVVISVTQVIS